MSLHILYGAYFIAVFFIILGLKMMSVPRTARRGNYWAGVGMLMAILATLAWPGLQHIGLMIGIIAAGGAIGWISARKVSMTDMPQMVALFNGMGGGAAAVIAFLHLLHGDMDAGLKALMALAGVIGSISFAGSVGAFLKLQRLINDRPITFPLQQAFNGLLLLASLGMAGYVMMHPSTESLAIFLALPLLLGFMMVLPIGGADMPVLISVFNALTGLAVAFDGFGLSNYTLIISGTIVGASGTLLTLMMAKAMNRSLANVLFGAVGTIVKGEGGDEEKLMKERSVEDAAVTMAYANRVIIIPGFGMAAAQAQHKVKELMDLLDSKGVDVVFAIHPVAGRMPGHMNVLLAEADIPYEKLKDIEEINEDFANTDVVLVIGANDVVNPAAEKDPNSPIYGMPILKAYNAKNVFVIKRGRGRGFAGIENELFFAPNTYMLFGDAKEVLAKLIQELKQT